MAATVASSYSASHGYQSSMNAEASTTQAAAAKASTSSSKASSSRSSHRSDAQDRFYGYRETSELCERFILYLFACPLDSTSASASLPSSNGTPAPRLSEFIAYALYRTRLPEAVTFQALYLLLRLKIRFPAARGSSGHRLFISALMIASKSSCDDTYSNKSWAIVGQGLFSLREINQMERELFGYLGYKVNVAPQDLEMFTYELEQDCDGGRIDLVVRKILELMSRRNSMDVGNLDGPPRERSDSVSSIKSSAPPTPALDSSDFSSPSLDSHAGPHRVASGRHSRQSSVSQSFSTRASISGSASTSNIAATSSASIPTATPMVKSASHRQERSATAPSFIHPFINNARERCRPYTTPVHSLPLSTSASSSSSSSCSSADRSYYSNSPAASISSSSMCSSMSYAPSTATPSPYASRSTMSGRTTPDTPPSDIDIAATQWASADEVASARYFGGAKVDLSPTSTGYKIASHHHHQVTAASDPYHLHPYNTWRS